MTAIIVLLAAAATFLFAYAVSERRRAADPARRIARYAAAGDAGQATDEQSSEARLRPWLARIVEQSRRLPGWSRFQTLVERAAVGVSPTALFGWIAGAAVFVLLAGAAVGISAVELALFVLLGAVGVRLWLGVRVTRRRRAFDDQLPELLSDLGSALRAGHGFNQALQAVARDIDQPAATELARVLGETRLGRPLEDALLDMGQRLDSRDLDFVLDAIVIQRQVGGSLAGVFEIVSESVRQRHQHVLRIRALTSMGRLSGLVLVALPVVLVLALSVISPGYFSPLLSSASGPILGVGAAIMLGVGSLWLKRIASLGGAA